MIVKKAKAFSVKTMFILSHLGKFDKTVTCNDLINFDTKYHLFITCEINQLG